MQKQTGSLATSGGSARRRPAQQRSRERVERILAAAGSIIAERGTEQLKMSEIAADSGMSLGALYQYFPDKAAVVRTLAEQYNSASRSCIAEALEPVASKAEFETAFRLLLQAYLAIVRAEPVMRDIWSGMHADKQLSNLQAAETQACADLLASVLLHVQPDADPATVQRSALLVWDLGEAAVRLAITRSADDGDALIESFTRMALSELLGN